MPIIQVTLSGNKDKQALLAKMIIEATTTHLQKNPNITAITFNTIEHDAWYIAGKTLKELSQNSFYLTINITDETNTKGQKADYIKSIFEGFSRILGNLNEESYIYVLDARAAAYGYGGLTQEYRYQHPA